jgi:hypothetical protein
MVFKRVPLPGSFLVVGMIGFVFSIIYWNSGKLSPPWAFTFVMFSIIIFVASMWSLKDSVELEKRTRSGPHHR